MLFKRIIVHGSTGLMDRSDLMGVLDAAKVCDTVVFVLDNDGLDASGDRLLSAILMQGNSFKT